MSWELDEYKKSVKQVARRVAKEQGWCKEGLNEVLDELGIERVSDRYSFEVTVTWTVNAVNESDEVDEPDEEFIESSLSDMSISFDSDWSDVDCNVDSVNITSVEAQLED